jgi:hypothetical protein
MRENWAKAAAPGLGQYEYARENDQPSSISAFYFIGARREIEHQRSARSSLSCFQP